MLFLDPTAPAPRLPRLPAPSARERGVSLDGALRAGDRGPGAAAPGAGAAPHAAAGGEGESRGENPAPFFVGGPLEGGGEGVRVYRCTYIYIYYTYIYIYTHVAYPEAREKSEMWAELLEDASCVACVLTESWKETNDLLGVKGDF